MTQTALLFAEPGAIILDPQGITISAHTDLSSHRGVGYRINKTGQVYRGWIKGYGDIIPAFQDRHEAEQNTIKRIDRMIAASPQQYGKLAR